MMTVLLKADGNPDLNQFGHVAPTFRLPVPDIECAVVACRDYIDRYDLGAGNWTGGLVQVDGEPVARIAYNGRVMEPVK